MTDTAPTLAEVKLAAEQVYQQVVQMLDVAVPDHESRVRTCDVKVGDWDYACSVQVRRLAASYSRVYQTVVLNGDAETEEGVPRDLDDYDYAFLAHLIEWLCDYCQPKGYAVALCHLDSEAGRKWVVNRFKDELTEFTVDLGTGTLTAYWARRDTPYKSTTECLREAFAAEKEQ